MRIAPVLKFEIDHLGRQVSTSKAQRKLQESANTSSCMPSASMSTASTRKPKPFARVHWIVLLAQSSTRPSVVAISSEGSPSI